MFHPDRPELKLPRTNADLALEIAAGIGVVASAVPLLVFWSRLPDEVPTHFGRFGAPDAWGSKTTLIILPIVCLNIYILMTAVGFVSPRHYNYPWSITQENAPRQYRTMRTLLVCIKAEVVWLFVVIESYMIRAAMKSGAGIPMAVIAMMVAVPLGSAALFIIHAARHR